MSMRIRVHLYNEIRSFASHLPADGTFEVPEGASPQTVLSLLGIPLQDQSGLILFCNGRPADQGPLQEGDRLVAFSPMHGG